ncbi:hypothetical protein FQ087_12490 [Sporosarcina sp. ANT_H38]|uniref:hypothetical protein n=1 Tax=Sporosarcina sp. ANT_H38 TaxID=2597358 RepID=UPI0011F1D562|nr:hypothetical protein [Sporosarcina sp. ANT_H38]KAA0955432.1 hypothetical protein FQ087_12490 [Sporosarcina sp. ANT_H38]
MLKKNIYAGILLGTVVLAACSVNQETEGQENEETTEILTDVQTVEVEPLSDTDKGEPQEEKTEIEIEDPLNSWNKINIELKKESPNYYYFENMDLNNGDLFLLHRENQGLKLKEGDSVLVDLTMVPDGLSHTGVGYILNGKYTEIFLAPVSDKLITSFDIEEDGDYIICIVGSNANFITITNGVISID